MRLSARHIYHNACVACLLCLIGLCLAWEVKLAPLRPGGSWLVLKTLPLLLPLRGLLHGKTYTFQWACMLILFYFAEGVVRAYTESGLSARLAIVEILLSSLFFITAIGSIRAHGLGDA